LPATDVSCEACSEQHTGTVEGVDYDGEVRLFINCPSYGRVPLDPERLKRWCLDLPGLARTIAELLAAKGRVKALIPNRVWHLGSIELGGRISECLMVRGLNWPDATQLLDIKSMSNTSPIILTLCDVSFTTLMTFTVPLSQLLSLDRTGLNVNSAYLGAVLSNQMKLNIRDEYIFRKQGDHWDICYEGRPLTLKHSLGLTYIAYLLTKPDQDISVFDLVSLSRHEAGSITPSAYLHMSKEQLESEGLSISHGSDVGDILDDEAIKQYKERLRDIEEELSEAEENCDTGRIEQLEAEKEFVVEQLKTAVGLGGRSRKAGSIADKARVAVRLSIQRAIEHIGKHDLELSQFLSNSIKTGITCKYSPDRNISWILL
jgi:hypothetical protein